MCEVENQRQSVAVVKVAIFLFVEYMEGVSGMGRYELGHKGRRGVE